MKFLKRERRAEKGIKGSLKIGKIKIKEINKNVKQRPSSTFKILKCT